jgi:hypothetical protein
MKSTKESLFMRSLLRYLFPTIILLFLLQVTVLAQQMVYGIQAHVFITPPYPLDLYEYTNVNSNKMWVQIIPDQNSRPIEIRIRIHFDEITGKFSLATRSSYIPPKPIELVGGIPVTLMAVDLIPYLSLENLDVRGGSVSEFNKTKRLPEGSYKIWVEIVSSRGETLSDNKIGSRIAMLVQNDAPQLVSPSDNQILTISEPQNILFTWRLGSLVNSVSNVQYQFTIVEIPNKDINKYIAIQTLTPLYVTTTYTASFRYDYMAPQLIPGRSYAYQVKASTIEGSSMFKNDGFSNVQSFTWGAACNTPMQLQCSFDSYTSEKVSWQPNGSKQFDLTYREITDSSASEWYTDKVTDNLVDVSNNIYSIIHNLKPGRLYECKVKAWCGFISSEYSSVISFRTQQQTAVNITKTCGSDAGIPDPSLLKRSSIQALSVGEEIEVGGFKAKITEVTKNVADTTFSGKCIVYVSTFGIKVASHFSNIKVNTDKKVFAGEIVAEYDQKNLVNADAAIADIATTASDAVQVYNEFKSLANDAKKYFASDSIIINIISRYDSVSVFPSEIKIGLEKFIDAIKTDELGRQLISQGKTAEGETKLNAASALKEEGKQIILKYDLKK